MNNRLLVVDDEKDIVEAYFDFLAPSEDSTPKKSSRRAAPTGSAPTAEGYEILKAYSGQEAIDIIRKLKDAGERVAGGFFDVKMAGLDGIQTIQAIWKIDPEVHCTIVTAYQDRSVQDIDVLFTNEFGPRVKEQWDFLNKPFTQGEIVQKARQMTSAWNRKRALEIAHAKLVEAERLSAIGQVSRGVGHEFGNILQRIVGKCDISMRESSIEKVRENLKLVLQAADRASVIVRNLQSFGKKTSDRVSVDLVQVIGDTLALINHELKTSNYQLVDSRKKVPSFQGNPIELQQVFLNLVINAMHATPKGGSVEVGCEQKGSVLQAWVKDTGSGISPDVLPRIFEFAFTTKGEKGSGLGLSISRQIIESHGGTIKVETEIGKGTKFLIELPLK